MKYSVILVLVILVLAVTSCGAPVNTTGKLPPIATPIDVVVNTTVGDNATLTTTTKEINVVDLSVVEKGLSEVAWITPGKVYIGNLYPGSETEWSVRIHNEKTIPTEFLVYAKTPDSVMEGYEKLPEEFMKWIVVDRKLSVAPRSVGDVNVIIRMGPESLAAGKKYEVWIAVMDNSQNSMVRTELCSRWFISTK